MTEPGWYVDPDDAGLLRWWDGARWTDRRGVLSLEDQAELARRTELSAPVRAAPFRRKSFPWGALCFIVGMLGVIGVVAIAAMSSQTVKPVAPAPVAMTNSATATPTLSTGRQHSSPTRALQTTAPDDVTPSAPSFAQNGPGAIKACEWASSEKLKAPATAQWSNAGATDLGDGKYWVTGQVDSENSFGALLRSVFTCSVVYTDDEVNVTANLIDGGE